MRKLFLFLVVLFLSFQQVTLAAIKEMTSTPDSVYLFSFATSGDDGRSGLRFAWSMDKENWFEVGRNYGYLRCDYSRWGSQKKMLDPYLKQSPAGEWICTWKLNDRDGYGQATSKDLINWTSQKYPRTTSDFDVTRVKAVVAGEEQKGTINRVAWTLVDGLNKNYGWNQYRNSLHEERPVQDGERFAGLKPVKQRSPYNPNVPRPSAMSCWVLSLKILIIRQTEDSMQNLSKTATSSMTLRTGKEIRTGIVLIRGH